MLNYEFITQKGDSFASIAKEEVDDIKTYERKLDIQRREEPWKIFEIGYFLNDRKTIQPKQSHGKLYLLGLYSAFNKVLCYNNERHKHTWFIKLYKEWVKVSRDLNKLYHQEHICYFQQIEQIYFFIEFSVPWIHKWVPEVDFTEEQIPCLYRTYYNNFWDKLMKKILKQSPYMDKNCWI
ncbi:hypothetical protein H5410_002244 [Solanum commersonii]|uniref:Uncharacterized protein n=1 Tax=Solanum commersonii TaxID=4109 RepID=A0A9J6B2C7_SOLCO|nr:hypothetical protein H5410_002244 [Solanum commersonii]